MSLFTPRRKEEAVRGLKKASPLVVSIALGQPSPQPHCRAPPCPLPALHGCSGRPGPQLPVAASRLLELQAYDIPGGHHKLNSSQNEAIRKALEKPFTVIQGPPGGPHAGGAGAALGHRGPGKQGGLCSPVLWLKAQARPWWASTSCSGCSNHTRSRSLQAASLVGRGGGGAHRSCTVAPPTSQWT